MKELQIALDTKPILDCIELVNEIRDYVDIVELGTPLVYKYGTGGIKMLKNNFPEKKILADFKIMDAGRFETRIALDAGADIVTVLAAADDKTIEDSLNEVKKDGKELLVDLISVEDVISRAKYLDSIGVDYICVHTGTDVQELGGDPLAELIEIKKVVKNSKISVAGGVKLETIETINNAGPDAIIVGGGLNNVENPKEVAKQMVDIIK